MFGIGISEIFMGTTREDVLNMMDLHRNGILNFSKNLSVMDIGTSQLHYYIPGVSGKIVNDKFVPSEKTYVDGKDFLKEVFELFGKSASFDEYFSGMLAQRFYKDLDFDYHAIDLDTYNNLDYVTKLDLNLDCCPENKRGQYDLVINNGTTEHLINQSNAFNVMHDLCKVGGVMLSTVPCFDINHGFFNYSPIFFKQLAKSNGYEIISVHLQYVKQNDNLMNIYVYSITRKLNDAEFIQPSQVFDNGNFDSNIMYNATYQKSDVCIII